MWLVWAYIEMEPLAVWVYPPKPVLSMELKQKIKLCYGKQLRSQGCLLLQHNLSHTDYYIIHDPCSFPEEVRHKNPAVPWADL